MNILFQVIFFFPKGRDDARETHPRTVITMNETHRKAVDSFCFHGAQETERKINGGGGYQNMHRRTRTHFVQPYHRNTSLLEHVL